MMKKVLFRDRQEARAEDFNNAQDYTQTTLDHIVGDAITSDARYKGLAVTKVSGTEIAISAGRLYDAGRAYNRDVATQKDFLAELPVSQQKIMVVVAYGQTIETSVEPRDFLINIEDETTEPQSVAMTEARRCEIGYLSGSEGVSPAAPTVQAGQVKVAEVLLDATGIVAITMSDETRLGGLEGANTSIRDLRDWRGTIGPRVDALQSTLADVRATIATKASIADTIAMGEAIAHVRREAGLPSGVLDWAFDDFRDAGRTDATPVDAAYQLNGRLNFPDSGAVATSLDLFSAIDSKAKKTVAGLILPAFENVLAIETSMPTGALNLSSYTNVTTDTETYRTYKTVTRTGTRQEGAGWANVQSLTVKSAQGSAGIQEVTLNRDSKNHLSREEWGARVEQWVDDATQQHGGVEDFSYATETYSYQERVPTTHTRQVASTQTYTGMTLAQTLLSPRLMWLTQIGLHFTDLDASGDVTVIVTGCDSSGHPNRLDVKSQTTVAHADLKRGEETLVTLEPALVEAGEKLAVMLVTQGSHKHAISTGVDAFQGEILYGDSTGWHDASDGNSAVISVYSAQFPRTRSEIRLLDVNLGGGISDLRVETETFAPQGTKVSFEYQIGGVWYPMAAGAQLVANLPSTVPVRMVLSGTTTMQPAVQSGPDRIEGSVAGTSLVHYSAARSLAAPSSNVAVEVVADLFDAANHTLTVELIDDDNAGAVVAAATAAVVSEIVYKRPDGSLTAQKAVLHRAEFTPASIQNYRVRISGTTGGAAVRPFAVLERVDHAS